MDEKQLRDLAEQFLDAWNSQDVSRVLSCYTDDLAYRDPNTHDVIHGKKVFSGYLEKLFISWRMHWRFREGYPISTMPGAAILWKASFRRADGQQSLELEGMDLVVLRGSQILRNDVYFDRMGLARLAPLARADETRIG